MGHCLTVSWRNMVAGRSGLRSSSRPFLPDFRWPGGLPGPPIPCLSLLSHDFDQAFEILENPSGKGFLGDAGGGCP